MVDGNTPWPCHTGYFKPLRAVRFRAASPAQSARPPVLRTEHWGFGQVSGWRCGVYIGQANGDYRFIEPFCHAIAYLQRRRSRRFDTLQ